jgi:hypothetical protein
VPTLYKYAANEKALSNMAFAATDPAFFNDPFEVRPYFDQVRHDYFAKSHEEFYARMGLPHTLLAGGSMVGIPTENAAGFGEDLNKRFRIELSKSFRVLCLSKNPSSALMWGHYADSHKGLLVGIDPASGGFSTGLAADGFEINYSVDRSAIKLPLAYYAAHSVETYDLRGNIVNRPDELVKSDGGIHIPFSEYRRQVEEVTLSAIRTKSLDWSYEKEVRFIYKLPEHADQLRFENKRCFVPIPPQAMREIIFGFQAPFELVQRVVKLRQLGKLGSPKFFFSQCHPFLYEVQRFEAQPEYILDYYKHVMPAR